MKNEAELEVAKFIKDELLERLTGRHNNFQRIYIPNWPHKRIILGSLAEEDPEFLKSKSTHVKANSITIEFLTKDSNVRLEVKPKLKLFYAREPSKEEIRKHNFERDELDDTAMPYFWKRKSINFPALELDEDDRVAHLDFSKVIEEIENDEEHNDYYGDNPPDYRWDGQVELEVEDYTQSEEDYKLVKVRLVNKTPPTEPSERDYETSFFDAQMKLDLKGTDLEKFKYSKKYGGKEERYQTSVQALNCQAEYDEEREIIETKPYKHYNQKRIIPRKSFSGEGGKENLDFGRLQKKGFISLLDSLREEMESLSDTYEESSKYGNSSEFRRRADNFKYVTQRFREGIEVLKNNEKARRAFRLMQETFDKSQDYSNWYIFQIVFIVSEIPDIVEPKRRETVDLLHVDTGGGKSEAYFALMVFVAFWERLKGKEFGVSGITKFPLRMLSVQQLERISEIFFVAEVIRREKLKEKGHPFSVAYFVGRSDEFPRHVYSVIERIKGEEKSKSNIFRECPLCEDGEIYMGYDEDRLYTFHECDTCGNRLRIFLSDEEIYRFIPTFIVSTVDKLAGIASQRRFKNILGGKLSKCPKGHGFIPLGDRCEAKENKLSRECGARGEKVDKDFSTSPILVVQDEAHLIREGFGTIDSHFETFMETMKEKFEGEKFKNITMTATMVGAERQNKKLYLKDDTRVFPGRSPFGKGKKSLFFKKDEDQEHQRFIFGLKPNARDNQFASLLTLRYLSEIINHLEKNIADFSNRHNLDESDVKDAIKAYKEGLTYHNKRSDVSSMSFYLHDVVNSKLEKKDYHVLHDTLTGRNSLQEIRDLINKISEFNRDNKEISCVSATSVVSHGVDIDSWNFMIFQGIPRSTAEYIQALSRIGRVNRGLVFLWFYPNRIRDISYFRKFNQFHENMEWFVEEIPIERWSKLGFRQTFHSLFCGSILNYLSDLLERPIYSVDDIQDVFFSNRDSEEYKKEIVGFLNECYGVGERRPTSEFLKEEIPKQAEQRLKRLREYSGNNTSYFPNALEDNEDPYYKMQYGMRGIQDTLRIRDYKEKPFIEKYHRRET